MEIESNLTSEAACGYFEGYSTQRFVIISTCAAMALFGVFANTILIAVFKKSLPSSIFLATLAACDTLICLTYILLFGVDAGIMYLKDTTLFFLYHRYIVPVFFMTKVVQFAIPFVLILITWERYLWTADDRTRKHFARFFEGSGKTFTVFLVVMASVVLRSPVFFSMEVVQFPKCEDYFRSESVSQKLEWAESKAYNIFDFHVITAVQMFFPFIVLLVLNLTIIYRLTEEKKHQAEHDREETSQGKMLKSKFSQCNLPANYVLLEVAAEVIKDSLVQKSTRSKRSQVRNAIFTMVAIVASYLVCNGIHLFITFLERTDKSLLYESEDEAMSSTFYIVLSDTVSICYMVSSMIRIFIYSKCNPKLRKEIAMFLCGHRKQTETVNC